MQNTITVVAVAILVGALSFWSGMKYDQYQVLASTVIQTAKTNVNGFDNASSTRPRTQQQQQLQQQPQNGQGVPCFAGNQNVHLMSAGTVTSKKDGKITVVWPPQNVPGFSQAVMSQTPNTTTVYMSPTTTLRYVSRMASTTALETVKVGQFINVIGPMNMDQSISAFDVQIRDTSPIK